MQTTFKTLTKLIKEHNSVLVMAHKNIDLDAFGSAICLSRILSSLNKENYVCLNKNRLNVSIDKSIKALKKNNININFISKSKLKDISKDTLLIILDTSKRELLEDENILNIVEDVVIIDHHVVNNKNILKTKLSYINSNLSSTNEILVEYLKYLNLKIEPLIATIMLAGIEVDTNSYNVKTTENTYQAAAYLMSLGASTMIKQEILKENKDDYFKREKYIENSYAVNNIMAICVIEDQILNKEDLAIISEKLLLFDNIKAAFTIGNITSTTSAISARSLGDINVFKIMKLFGGGGHITDAAAQIKNKSVRAVEQELVKIIEVIK